MTWRIRRRRERRRPREAQSKTRSFVCMSGRTAESGVYGEDGAGKLLWGDLRGFLVRGYHVGLLPAGDDRR